MNVRIGRLTFDHVSYDAQGDVLYLHVGPPQAASTSEETPEGHVLRFDAHGRVVGLTLVNARWLVERDGRVSVTFPDPDLHADARDLAAALGLAS